MFTILVTFLVSFCGGWTLSEQPRIGVTLVLCAVLIPFLARLP